MRLLQHTYSVFDKYEQGNPPRRVRVPFRFAERIRHQTGVYDRQWLLFQLQQQHRQHYYVL